MWLRFLVGQVLAIALAATGSGVAVDVAVGHRGIAWTCLLTVLVVTAALTVSVTLWALSLGRALFDAVGRSRPPGGRAEWLAAHQGPRSMRALVECVNEVTVREQAHAYFVADVAHQLRTALQLLQLRLEQLGQLVPADGSALHAQAMADVDHLHGTLAEHLELAKLIESSPVEEVRLGEVVRDRVAAWSDVAARGSVRLDDQVEADAVVLARRGALDQLLDILLDNAIRHSPKAAAITVRVSVARQAAMLEVQDEGPGMTAKQVQRINMRHWRSYRDYGGLHGLGLCIASMLATRHGGQLILGAGPGGRGLNACCRFPALREHPHKCPYPGIAE